MAETDAAHIKGSYIVAGGAVLSALIAGVFLWATSVTREPNIPQKPNTTTNVAVNGVQQSQEKSNSVTRPHNSVPKGVVVRIYKGNSGAPDTCNYTDPGTKEVVWVDCPTPKDK